MMRKEMSFFKAADPGNMKREKKKITKIGTVEPSAYRSRSKDNHVAEEQIFKGNETEVGYNGS